MAACSLGFRSRTFLASASNAGVQFMSSIMFAVGGPLFRDQYHLASSDVAIIMAVVIPFSGVITQVSGSEGCALSLLTLRNKKSRSWERGAIGCGRGTGGGGPLSWWALSPAASACFFSGFRICWDWPAAMSPMARRRTSTCGASR